LSIPQCRLACAIFAMSLAFTLGCSQKTSTPEQQQSLSSANSIEASPWHVDLKVSPDHPRMVRPLTLTLHITDDHAQPVTDAEVNGALTMKEMNMGTTQLKFAPKGNGDYEAAMKSMDMSGLWSLAVDALQGPVHAKMSFAFTVYD
jgi:nitrogen fixation protein FixH